MPFANLPLRFIAKAQTQGPRLSFVDSSVLVRYVPYDSEDVNEKNARPEVESVVRADNGRPLPANCWSVVDVGGSDHVRVLEVSFHGGVLNGELGSDPERLFAADPVPAVELHNAFLEQALINVQVLMSPADVTEYYTGLQLHLSYVEV